MHWIQKPKKFVWPKHNLPCYDEWDEVEEAVFVPVSYEWSDNEGIEIISEKIIWITNYNTVSDSNCNEEEEKSLF